MTTKEKFVELFKDEFDDPNEIFLYFLLSLIPDNILNDILILGSDYYYKNLESY